MGKGAQTEDCAVSFWNEEREAELRRLAPNHTAGQIADKLGAKSRSAVIGKIHRLKLRLNPDRPRGQARPKITRPAKAKPSPVARANPTGTPSRGPSPPIPTNVGSYSPPMSTIGGRYQCGLVHLSSTTCRFPCWGDDVTPFSEQRYCGATAVEGLPYCHTHCRAAYTAPRPVTRGQFVAHSISPRSSQGGSVPISFATARELRESSELTDDSRFFCGND